MMTLYSKMMNFGKYKIYGEITLRLRRQIVRNTIKNVCTRVKEELVYVIYITCNSLHNLQNYIPKKGLREVILQK